jgi:DNA-directed RNA polymerase specialized sigma24 family protein
LATAPDVISAMEMLADLPEDQRALVTARVIEERSYGELAGEQGLSETAVRKRVSRGLATLRGRLQEGNTQR